MYEKKNKIQSVKTTERKKSVAIWEKKINFKTFSYTRFSDSLVHMNINMKFELYLLDLLLLFYSISQSWCDCYDGVSTRSKDETEYKWKNKKQ